MSYLFSIVLIAVLTLVIGLTLYTLFIARRDDRILDPREQGQAMADWLPHIDLEMIEGRHMLPITQPDVTADFIERQMWRQA